MPCEIGLSDGTKLHVDVSAIDVMQEVQSMSRSSGGSPPPYGDWQMFGPEQTYFNPAHVVYVKDTEREPLGRVTW